MPKVCEALMAYMYIRVYMYICVYMCMCVFVYVCVCTYMCDGSVSIVDGARLACAGWF
jgi:hypothetical protein